MIRLQDKSKAGHAHALQVHKLSVHVYMAYNCIDAIKICCGLTVLQTRHGSEGGKAQSICSDETKSTVSDSACSQCLLEQELGQCLTAKAIHEATCLLMLNWLVNLWALLLSLADRPKATGSLTVSSQSNLSPASHPCTDKPENLAEVILNR